MSGIDDVSKTLGELTAGIQHISKQLADLGARNTRDHDRVRSNVQRLFDRNEELSHQVIANGEEARRLEASLNRHFESTDRRLKALAEDTDKLKSVHNRQVGWIAGAATVGSLVTGVIAWFADRIWAS
ncbi:hypothetical protein [Pyruvatibacter sp.]